MDFSQNKYLPQSPSVFDMSYDDGVFTYNKKRIRVTIYRTITIKVKNALLFPRASQIPISISDSFYIPHILTFLSLLPRQKTTDWINGNRNLFGCDLKGWCIRYFLTVINYLTKSNLKKGGALVHFCCCDKIINKKQLR